MNQIFKDDYVAEKIIGIYQKDPYRFYCEKGYIPEDTLEKLVVFFADKHVSIIKEEDSWIFHNICKNEPAITPQIVPSCSVLEEYLSYKKVQSYLNKIILDIMYDNVREFQIPEEDIRQRIENILLEKGYDLDIKDDTITIYSPRRVYLD